MKGFNTVQKWIKGEKPRTGKKKIPPGAWMFVSCESCVLLSGKGLCDEPIPRPEESYRLWCVSQCDQKELQTSILKRETGVGRRGRLKKKRILRNHVYIKYSNYKCKLF
jgi:hypothetical protein